MQKIVPHFWFDTQAKEAAVFYTSLFPKSKVTHIQTLHNTPSGDCDTVTFELNGYQFAAISAGPYFKLNPAISFMVNFDPSKDADAEQQMRQIWEQLITGGKALMPLQEYPFSKLYGWVEDKYGVSWQLIFTDPEGEERPFIMPSFLFGGTVAGQAAPAVDFYLNVFKNAKLGTRVFYGPGQEPNKEGYVMFSDCILENSWFTAMDSSMPHDFSFNEAVSFMVKCENQAEIDYYWEKLSADPSSEQCGWLKDKFGVSWQITPVILDTMMSQGTPEQVERVTQAFLQMKKFDVAALETAFAEE